MLQGLNPGQQTVCAPGQPPPIQSPGSVEIANFAHHDLGEAAKVALGTQAALYFKAVTKALVAG